MSRRKIGDREINMCLIHAGICTHVQASFPPTHSRNVCTCEAIICSSGTSGAEGGACLVIASMDEGYYNLGTCAQIFASQ